MKEQIKTLICKENDELHNSFSMGMLYGGLAMATIFGFSEKQSDFYVAAVACFWVLFWILVQVFYKRKEI